MIKSVNNGFRFKQFAIEHDQCAMKVGTDSIILGAWVTSDDAKYVLDIGTGSGILAMMMAQKSASDSMITAVEIEPAAVRQARSNVQNSKFAHKIIVIEADIKAFQASLPYDLIIANPPYFKATKKYHHNTVEANQARVYARSQQHLTHRQLIEHVARLLSDSGLFYCVIPSSEANHLVEFAHAAGLHVVKQLNVRNDKQSDNMRCCLALSHMSAPSVLPAVEAEQLVIYQDEREYTEQYRTLCQHFYLNF